MKKLVVCLAGMLLITTVFYGCGRNIEEKDDNARQAESTISDVLEETAAESEEHKDEETGEEPPQSENAEADAGENIPDTEADAGENILDKEADAGENISDTEEFFEDMEPTEDGDGNFRELTREELDEFTAFIRRADAYGFLLSEYDMPNEADLGEVFYFGAGLSSVASLEEAEAYLIAAGQEELFTTCAKIERSSVEALLKNRLGLELTEADLDAVGIYLPEYDAYFREEGDVNYVEYTAVKGLYNGYTYTVEFKSDQGADFPFSDVQALLIKSEDGYQFIANQSLK